MLRSVSSVEMNKDIARAHRLYIDANIIIYFAEGDDERQSKSDAIFAHAQDKNIPVITSEISIAECLRGVYVQGDGAAEEKYKSLFYDTGFFHLVPVGREIIEHSAKVGVSSRLKLIDSIHVASAISVGCDVFVTNDRGIKSIGGLKVVQLSEI